MVDINTVRGSGQRRDAIAANEAFINEERLLAAALAGKTPFQEGPLVGIFVADGKSVATAIELEALDEE